MISRRTRRAASVALVALGLAGVRAASAAGVDGAGPQVLVGRGAAEQCSSARVQVDYDVAYDAALGAYGVGAARLSGLTEHCQGYDVSVVLSGPGGAPLAEITAVVEGSDAYLVVPTATPVSAHLLTGVAVVLRSADAQIT